MVDTLLITLIIVAISLLLLGVKLFFVKGGRFPDTHISHNKAMREKGIGCVQSQDRQARKRTLYTADELERMVRQ